jgi:DNA anti-recombination protein RmuC
LTNEKEKIMKYHGTILIMSAAILAAGCSPTTDDAYMPPPADPVQPTETRTAEIEETNAARITEQAMEVSKETVIARVESSMEAIDERLESVSSNLGELEDAGRAEVEPVLATLQERRQELDELAERMKEATGQTLQELEREFQAAYKALLKTLEETEERLRG